MQIPRQRFTLDQKEDLRDLTRSTAFMACYLSLRQNLISRSVIPQD